MKESAGKILMFLENNYPQDTRVRNEANLLVTNGYQVVIICYKKEGQPSFEVEQGVFVYRVPRLELFKKTADGAPGMLGRIVLKVKSFIGYVVEYSYFTSACFLLSLRVFFKHGFDVIHAHNPPDTLFAAALPYKLIGKKFIFDHHDLCPELYMSRYGSREGALGKMLRVTEWCSLKLADITIATNESYKAAHVERANKDPETIFIVRNGPAEGRMIPVPANPKLRALGKSIFVYIGSLNPQDGVDYLLRALHKLVYEIKREDFHCVIMGSGDSLEDLRQLATELKLNDYVNLTGFVSEEDLRSNLAAADICVDPDPSSPLNDVSTWIKIMEYMAYGKPIVTFDLKETRFSAQDAAVYVKPNDEAAFAAALAQMMDDPAARARLGQFGRKRVEEELQWSVVSENLLQAYSYLYQRTKPQSRDTLQEVKRVVQAS